MRRLLGIRVAALVLLVVAASFVGPLTSGAATARSRSEMRDVSSGSDGSLGAYLRHAVTLAKSGDAHALAALLDPSNPHSMAVNQEYRFLTQPGVMAQVVKVLTDTHSSGGDTLNWPGFVTGDAYAFMAADLRTMGIQRVDQYRGVEVDLFSDPSSGQAELSVTRFTPTGTNGTSVSTSPPNLSVSPTKQFRGNLCEKLAPYIQNLTPGQELDQAGSGPLSPAELPLQNAVFEKMTPVTRVTAGFACQWTPPGSFAGAVINAAVRVVRTDRVVSESQEEALIADPTGLGSPPTNVKGIGDWAFLAFMDGPSLYVGHGRIMIQINTADSFSNVTTAKLESVLRVVLALVPN